VAEMNKFRMVFVIIAAMIVIAITVIIVINVRESQPEIWRQEAMAYIDSLILLYDDKPDVVKGNSDTPDYFETVYLYRNKSLNKLKGCIENSTYISDVTNANLANAAPPYIYLDDRLVSDSRDFVYHAPNKVIRFGFSHEDSLEFNEYIIEIFNTTDPTKVVRVIE
jgi:hypothetical protein